VCGECNLRLPISRGGGGGGPGLGTVILVVLVVGVGGLVLIARACSPDPAGNAAKNAEQWEADKKACADELASGDEDVSSKCKRVSERLMREKAEREAAAAAAAERAQPAMAMPSKDKLDPCKVMGRTAVAVHKQLAQKPTGAPSTDRLDDGVQERFLVDNTELLVGYGAADNRAIHIDINPPNYSQKRDGTVLRDLYSSQSDHMTCAQGTKLGVSITTSGVTFINLTEVERRIGKEQRPKVASQIQDEMRVQGATISVSATGRDSTELDIEWAACDKAWLSTIADKWKLGEQGFKHVECNDGMTTYSLDY
jgi:hypothetical protein